MMMCVNSILEQYEFLSSDDEGKKVKDKYS